MWVDFNPAVGDESSRLDSGILSFSLRFIPAHPIHTPLRQISVHSDTFKYNKYVKYFVFSVNLAPYVDLYLPLDCTTTGATAVTSPPADGFL